MKKALILVVLFLLISIDCQAVYLIGTESSNHSFELISPKDPRLELIIRVIFEREWPKSPKNPRIDHHKSSDPEIELDEKTRLNNYVAIACKAAKLNCQDIELVWVPQTIWELTLLSSDVCFENKLNEDQLDAYIFEKEKFAYLLVADVHFLFFLEQTFLDNFLKLHPSPLKMKDWTGVNFVTQVSALLRHISSSEKNEKLRNDLWQDIHLLEMGQPDVFSEVVRLEVLAHQRNQIVLFRGTDGIHLEELFTSSQNQFPFKNLKNKERRPAPEAYIELSELLIDAPFYWTIGRASRLSSKDLSYGHSPLAGYFLDKDACSIAYSRKFRSTKRDSKLFYAVLLDRKWAHDYSKTYGFQMGEIPSAFQLFGAGETFHARLNHNEEPEDSYEIIRYAKEHRKLTQDPKILKSLSLMKILISSSTEILLYDQKVLPRESVEAKLIKKNTEIAYEALIEWTTLFEDQAYEDNSASLWE